MCDYKSKKKKGRKKEMKQTKRVLSVVLALAMVFAMSIMVSAATTPMCKVVTEKSADGSTIKVTLLGTGENLAKFDYGVAYNNKALEVVPSEDEEAVTWGDRMLKIAMKTCNDQGDYVVLGGTHSGDKFTVDADAVIATVTFKVTDAAAADASNITVVADSAVLVDGKVDFEKATGAAITPVKEIVAPTQAPVESQAPVETQAPVDGQQTPDQQTPGQQTPATKAPTTQAPTSTTKAPKTADTASVVVPVVAIVAAAAAVVVVSKKRVEE